MIPLKLLKKFGQRYVEVFAKFGQSAYGYINLGCFDPGDMNIGFVVKCFLGQTFLLPELFQLQGNPL